MVNKTELRKLLTDDKLVYGSDRVLKSVRSGQVKRVFLASNAPSQVRGALTRYQPLGGFTIEETDLTNDELGTACKKPFSIAALALLS